jgi:hypothetical protein
MALNGVRDAVLACGHGQAGVARVFVTFASTGRVITVSVTPPFAGTPAGACIARAVRTTSVPVFSRPCFTVSYPFTVR